jgi:hypothetical protein
MSKSRDLSRIARFPGVAANKGAALGSDGADPAVVFPRRNGLLNANFSIWQRGTSFTPAAGIVTYTADRWTASRATTGLTVTRQTTFFGNNQYSIKLQRTAGDAVANQITLSQVLETADSRQYAGKTVTLSFSAVAGANFSAPSSTIQAIIRTGTGTDQSSANFISSAWTGNANLSQNVALTTTGTRYSLTYDVPAGINQLGIVFIWNTTGTAGADDSMSFEQIQLEVNSVATPFEQVPTSLTSALCLRYFQTLSNFSVTTYQIAANSTTIAIKTQGRMRITPTVSGFTFTSSNVNAGTTLVGSGPDYLNLTTGVAAANAAVIMTQTGTAFIDAEI